MTALASPDELCTRLGRTTPGEDTPEYAQLASALDDASAEIQAAIGQALTYATSTVIVIPDDHDRRGSYVPLPALPVVSIDSVTVNGEEVSYRVRQNTLYLPLGCLGLDVEVTYSHGWTEIPDDIKRWTCVLAASALSAADKMGTLGITAGVSQHSKTIDDYTESWANYSGTAPGMSLPPNIASRLRAAYGHGGVDTVHHR